MMVASAVGNCSAGRQKPDQSAGRHWQHFINGADALKPSIHNIMARIIELITAAEIADLEARYGPITVDMMKPVEPQGEELLPEPVDPDEYHAYYARMMESNMGPVRR
jgi:hypothetical protein